MGSASGLPEILQHHDAARFLVLLSVKNPTLVRRHGQARRPRYQLPFNPSEAFDLVCGKREELDDSRCALLVHKVDAAIGDRTIPARIDVSQFGDEHLFASGDGRSPDSGPSGKIVKPLTVGGFHRIETQVPGYAYSLAANNRFFQSWLGQAKRGVLR